MKIETHKYDNNGIEINEKELYYMDIFILYDNYKEWRKRAFESKPKIVYDMKILNEINNIHDNEVNNIAEFNLPRDTFSTYKRTKILNINYSPILRGFVNTCRGKAKFNNFRILLDSGCNSTVVMRSVITKLTPKEEDVIQWHTLPSNITTKLKVKIDFSIPGFSTTEIEKWNFHVDDSAKCRYDMILRTYILTAL